MSLEAMQWAMSKAPLKRDASQCRNRLVLVALADRYNNDTQVAWPSVGRIAEDLNLSKVTVLTALDRLESEGLIFRSSPHWVSHLPANRRPTVWGLNMSLVRDKDALTARGKDVLTPRGKDVLTDGVKTSLPKPKGNPIREPKGGKGSPSGVDGAGGQGPGPSLDSLDDSPPLCRRHEGLDPVKVPPCRGCARERELWERARVEGEVGVRLARRAAVDGCPICDENGWVVVQGAARRCEHPPQVDSP